MAKKSSFHTGEYYWEYKLYLSNRSGATGLRRISKYFKNKKTAELFKNKLKAKRLWNTGILYYIESPVYHTIVWDL